MNNLQNEIPEFARLVARLLATLFVVTLGIAVYQTGGVRFKALAIKFEKLNPVTNLQRLMSLRSIVRTGAALARQLRVAPTGAGINTCIWGVGRSALLLRDGGARRAAGHCVRAYATSPAGTRHDAPDSPPRLGSLFWNPDRIPWPPELISYQGTFWNQ